MKLLLQTLLVIIALGLCGICTVQWQREAQLRGRIEQLVRQLEAENKLRVQAEQKVEEYGREIERLNGLRSEIETKLLTTTEELRDRTVDQLARGYSIALHMNEAIRATSELQAYKQLAGQGTEALKKHNETVFAQNSAIEKANAQLRQLARERDEAISQLNERTKAFNELVEKYNKLGNR